MRNLRYFMSVVVLGVILCGTINVLLAQEAPASLANAPGKIAYIGDDHNVHIYTPASAQIADLTTDASGTRHYLWPTWSTDGRLAYFCCDLQFANQRPDVQVFISQDAADPGKLIYQVANEAFTYAYWSPMNCDAGATCRDLAVLLSMLDQQAFKVELIRDNGSNPTTRTAGTGTPYYYSWSPDGHQMLWQRDNRTMTLYDAVSDEVITNLDQSPGLFPAPAWSPTDDRLLFGALDTENLTTDLTLLQNDESTILQAGIEGLLAFSWSPDGRYIAYRNVQRGQGVNPLKVIDTTTGEITAQSAESGIAFFWSPDSQKIAYITFASGQDAPSATISTAQQGPLVLSWSVMDLATNTERAVARFSPTAETIYLINYFDQFNQSHRLWSPDNTHIVYAEILASGRSSVTVLDTTAVNAVPFSIANGVIGVWSYD